MISRMSFAHKRKNFIFIEKLKGVYAVESEHRNDIIYLIDDTRFCIVDLKGLVFCPIHEVPQLAAKMKRKYREEVLEIYEDIKDMQRMGIIYA